MTDLDQPPRLIQYWDQPEPPAALLERMEGWRQKHPGWTYRRYDRVASARFMRSIYGTALEEAFLDVRLPAMQADVFRIAFLLAFGGLWVDAATTCFSPVETWLDFQAPLLLLRRSHQHYPQVCNGLIHALAPRHPLLAAAWQSMESSLLTRTGVKVYRSFGPGLLRDLLASGSWDHTLTVWQETDLSDHLCFGSSSKVLPPEQHWSQRQQSESLYFSGG